MPMPMPLGADVTSHPSSVHQPASQPSDPVSMTSAAPEDGLTFRHALVRQLEQHGESHHTLLKAILGPGESLDRSTMPRWISGRSIPRGVMSMRLLARIEQRYGLPSGYFRARVPQNARAVTGFDMSGATDFEKGMMAWHLPDDFDTRSASEQAEITSWVKTVIIAGSTTYSRYQMEATKRQYAVQFPSLLPPRKRPRRLADPAAGARSGVTDAPPGLAAELADLIEFKTATLTDVDFQRKGRWNQETAHQRIQYFGFVFGALAASPDGPVQGAGVPPDHLSFALLASARVWHWYIMWRERRRGFYTDWERTTLVMAASLARSETGWLAQHPELATRLMPVEGLISAEEVEAIKSDWAGACERLRRYARTRVPDVERVARAHRDPFEALLPVLEAPSPLTEYLKIAEEILKYTPDARLYPKRAAEMARAYLIVRLGLHLGLRQKNLRELLVCPRGRPHRSMRALETQQRGELRWNDQAGGWEVIIPANAFKNASSPFFAGAPYKLLLPDLGGLYGYIDAYIATHRDRILDGRKDPETFFVCSNKSLLKQASYDRPGFYTAWRLIIRRYGIYNPYTGRGAIKGLLPHGPHGLRDVLATHILKETGSFEQASYAIQDTTAMAAKHYVRFLPEDKTAMAARILDRVWAQV